MKNEPSNEPSSKPRHQSSTYRPLPPREYALGSEIRRADASFAPTLLSSSSLRRSTTGSQYSWSSRGSGSHRSAGGRTTGQIQQAGLEGRGGGLSSVSISMIPGENNSEVSPVNSAAHVSEQQQQPQDSNETADPPQSSHQLSSQHEQDASAMGRISEHDETDTSGISSLKHNLRESEDNVEIFERSDMFGRSLSDSIGYQRNSGDSSGSSLLPSSPNPGISPYEAAVEEESPVPVGESNKKVVNPSDMLTSLFNEDESDDERDFQQQKNKRLPQDQLPNPNSRLKHEVTATPQATNALPTITDIKSPSSVSTMDSESYHPEMAATARFGRLLQQCRALTETCEDSTVDESDRIGSSAKSEQKDVVAAASAALPAFEPAKLKLNSEIQTSGRVYNASEITMDPYIKSEFESRERQTKERKSFVSELSLGVDRMYNDQSEADYTENKMVRSYSRGSHMSELSSSDRRGDEALAKLTVNPNAKSADEHQRESSRPDFMRYLSNVSEKDDDDRRSWLSYTDDERTPRNNTQSKQMIRTYKVPVSDKPQFQSNFRRRMADSGTATPQQSPQSSFYSTDFSDEGSGGLLVGFGKRRKSSSSSESSSSSSGFTDSSGSTDDSGSSGSSSSSESEEETEESEPSMPTIARRGLRLTHLNDDDVSALSFGGASALVASAPLKVPLGTPNLLPEGNSRSRLSETSSTPSKSLDKSNEDTKESSPESEESKRSGKSSGSDLFSAGGRPRRRSSLTGAENLSEFGSVGPSAVPARRASIGDLPQLEEESSQASSTSPSPEAPTTARPTVTSRTASYDEASAKATSRRSSKSSKSASFNSKRDVPTQNENTSTTENAEPSPKAISSSTSKLSKSSSSSHGSKPIVPTQMIQSESNTLHEIYQYPPKGARSSNSSKSLAASTGSKESANVSAESLPTAASVSRLSSPSKSNSNGLGSEIAPVVATAGPMGSMQPSGQDSNEMPHYNIGQSSTFVQDKSPLHQIETVQSFSNSITPKLKHQSDEAMREQPRVPGNRHLKQVAEESSDIQSSDFVMPLAAQNDNVPLHSNEYTSNNAAFDDELSVTSSLSSVVSKARVSFQITYTSSVASALSDHHSREETKSRGSFRKSASDMIAERQSSKASVDKSREGNQLDLSTKSEVKETCLYESFPSQSDEVIRNKRTETARFHASRDSTEEVDARKPWRTASSKDCQADNDSSMFSEDVESAKLVTQAAIEESVSDEESAMSEVAKSKAALMSMGLYDDPVDEGNTDAARDEIGVNPILMPEQHGSKVQPKHLSRTSTASSITEWDFSDQNKGKKSDVLKPLLLETDPIEDIPYKASTSFSSEDTPSAPSLEDPSASFLSAAAMPIDTSSKSTTSKSSSKMQHLLDQQTTDPDPANEEDQPHCVKFAAEVANNSPDKIKQVESDESPITEDKRERYRKSMLDAANEMSQRLEKSFLARSQQQTNDFESRSYEDLSSASEEDVVLAYLREEKNFAYDSPKSNELDVSENEPEEKPMTGSTVKSKASNLWSRLRQSVVKPSPSEAAPSEALVEENLNSSIAAVSDSEYVVAEITPIFPGSERSSGAPRDDSDVESGIVPTKGGDDGSTNSSWDPNAKTRATILWERLRSSLGRLSAVTEEMMTEGKRAEDSDASALGSEHVHDVVADTTAVKTEVNQDVNSEEDGGEADQDEPAKAWYLDKEFYKSKYFLIAASCFLFILIVVISVGARKRGGTPLPQPTNAPMPTPETLPPSLQSPSVWVQVGNDIEGEQGDNFGFSVSASELGDRFIVGSRRRDKDNMKNRGAALIYQFDELKGTYALIAEIHGEQAGDQCGYSVSMSKNGKRVAVGALGSDKNGNNSGQVRVFEEDATEEWVLIAEFLGETSGSLFGTSLSLSQDGSRIGIGAPYFSTADVDRIGKTYIYHQIDDTTWNPMGDPIIGLFYHDLFGWSLTWSPDSALLAVGAPGEDSVTSSGFVKVYAFESNQWVDYGDLISADIFGDRFGFSMYFGGNATTPYRLAVGAPGTNSANGDGSGFAGVYEYDEGWLQVGSGIHGGWGENLGYAVSLTPDTSRLVVGVPHRLTNGLPSGEVQVIDIKSGSLVPTAEISGDAGEDFGVSVAISYDGRIVYGGTTSGDLVRVLGEL